jgi:hypothetical protein
VELIKAEGMPENFILCDMSDFHLGSPNCAEETLEETVAKIHDNTTAYMIFKGDAIECILPSDKRYMHSAVKDNLKSPKEQADRVIEIMQPIKNRILAWGIGNHEVKLWNTMDFGKYIADSLGVPYGAYNYKITYTDTKNRLMFKTYHTHGMGGVSSNAKDQIQYDANRRAGLKHKLSKSGHADVIYMSRGHDHQLITVDPTAENQIYLTDDGQGLHQHYRVLPPQNTNYIPPDSRWYATTGSFRKLYSKPGSCVIDYGEVAGYSPSEVGYVQVNVNDSNITSIEKVVC